MKTLEEKATYAREWYRLNIEKARATARKHKRKMLYGLTDAQYREMLENQGGLCAICTLPMHPSYGTCVDHDHETGQVRGLLCRSCNVKLGVYENSPVDSFKEYLGN